MLVGAHSGGVHPQQFQHVVTTPPWPSPTWTAAKIFAYVPSTDHRRCRSATDCQAPNSSGRSRHGDPVRCRQIMPSKVRRWSFHGRPPRRRPEGITGSISTHKSSETTFIRITRTASGTTPFPLDRHVLIQGDRYCFDLCVGQQFLR